MSSGKVCSPPSQSHLLHTSDSSSIDKAKLCEGIICCSDMVLSDKNACFTHQQRTDGFKYQASETICSKVELTFPTSSIQYSSFNSNSFVRDDHDGDTIQTDTKDRKPFVCDPIDSVSDSNLKKDSTDKVRRRSITEDIKHDQAYWEKRRRNNESAKKSRDARRMKEEQIALKVVCLEQENLQLRTEATMLRSELNRLRRMLCNTHGMHMG